MSDSKALQDKPVESNMCEASQADKNGKKEHGFLLGVKSPGPGSASVVLLIGTIAANI